MKQIHCIIYNGLYTPLLGSIYLHGQLSILNLVVLGE